MAARPVIAFFFVFILGACQLPAQHTQKSGPGLKTPEKSPLRFCLKSMYITVDKSPHWELAAYGWKAYFPAQKDFGYHSLCESSNAYSRAYSGMRYGKATDNIVFTAMLAPLPERTTPFPLDRFADFMVKRLTPGCAKSIERKILLDLPGKRQGEVFRCYLKKDPKVQEITVQLWVTEGSMLFNTDWREHFPASDRISLNEPRWRARFDSMNQAVLCPTAKPDELSDVCRRWMSAGERPVFKPLED